MTKVLLKQFVFVWKQGIVLFLSVVLCSLGCICLIRPLKLYSEQIAEDKSKVYPGFYSFICKNLNCSSLNSIENDLSEIGDSFFIAFQKEYEVEYLNFKGRGNAITLSDSEFERIEKTYDRNQTGYYKLQSGMIPERDYEVLLLGFAYTDWSYSKDEDEKVEKAAVLPGIGECVTVGQITALESESMPSELCYGLIIPQETFELALGEENVTVYIVSKKELVSAEEEYLKSAISKYGEIEKASFNQIVIDTKSDEDNLSAAIGLSLILLFVVLFCAVLVLADFIKGNMGFIGECNRIGMTELNCFLLNEALVALYLIVAEGVLFVILYNSSEYEKTCFLDIGICNSCCLNTLLALFFLIACSVIYFRLKRKGYQG